MVVYYLNKVSERLADYSYPIKEGDICLLYDGEIVKIIYIDSENDKDSIWRDFKFIDSKSLKSYLFPTVDSVLCAPLGNKHAIGNTGLLTQLIQECKGEWLLDFLNETSAVLSGFVDYWDLCILNRLIGDDSIKIEYENEEKLSLFIDKPIDDTKEVIELNDEEEEDDNAESLPINDAFTSFCLSALNSVKNQMDWRSYKILSDTLNGDSRAAIASKFQLTQERIRQIIVKSIRKAEKLLVEQNKSFEQTKVEIDKLNVQLDLLREEIVGLKKILPKDVVFRHACDDEEVSAELSELLGTSVEQLNLSARVVKTLFIMGVVKFMEIPHIESHMQVLNVRHSGPKTVHDISMMLKDFKLTFGMSFKEIVETLNNNDWRSAKRKWIRLDEKTLKKHSEIDDKGNNLNESKVGSDIQNDSPLSDIEDNNMSSVMHKGSNEVRIEDYGARSFIVVGDTKPHKASLKAMGGYFVIRTLWGPGWVFSNKNRELVQTYIDGNTSSVRSLEDNGNEAKSSPSSRYKIRVKYPNGTEVCDAMVWKTLVDVINYAGPEIVRQLNIKCMGDNLVSRQLNDNLIYRTAQKDIGRGFYVCTYSSTETKYNQIVRINNECRLGLIVEKVYVDDKGIIQKEESDGLYDLKELNTESKDILKYSFEGGAWLSKSLFVLEVIKYYVKKHPQVSYETLIRVFPASLNSNKSHGVIKRYKDVLKQIALDPTIRKSFFLKEDEIITLWNDLKIVVHNQWGNDFENFLKVAKSLYKVRSKDGKQTIDSAATSSTCSNSIVQEDNKKIKEDKRIGSTVRIFPSQLKGVIVDTKVDSKGIKKLVIKTASNTLIDVTDLPYLYEVLKKK